MAEADPRDRDRDRLGMPEGWGSGKLLWSLSKHDLHYSQVACGVILTYRATTYSLTHLPLTAYRCPPHYSPLTTHHSLLSPLHFGLGTADKSVAYFRALTLEMHFAASFHLPPTASYCLLLPRGTSAAAHALHSSRFS